MLNRCKSILSLDGSGRGLTALLVAAGIELVASQAAGKTACFEGEETVECVAVETQTDPAPYVIGPFGIEQFPAPYGQIWIKWRGVEADVEADKPLIKRCRELGKDCPWPPVSTYISIVDEARKRQGLDRINYVNRTMNSIIRYVSDINELGIADLWMAPITSIQAARGDCEDYAIGKYMALREAGTAVEDLQLVLVRNFSKHVEHMVVGVRHEKRWLILDNQITGVHEDSEFPFYVPLFAIDDRGVRQYGKPPPVRGFRLMDLASVCEGSFS